MTDIYRQYKKAFSNVSAYVILYKGDPVATIAFKFPRDGAGLLYAYVHWLGLPMVKGHASGYGYDKCSASIESAITRFELPGDYTKSDFIPFMAALKNVGGSTWYKRLEDAGFTVLQAV